MLKSISIIIFSCLLLHSFAQEQNPLSLADKYFGEGNYEMAFHEYNRELLFSSSNDDDGFYLKMADCKYMQQHYYDAIQLYDNAIFLAEDSFNIARAYYGKVSSFILSGGYIVAKVELASIPLEIKKLYAPSFCYLEGICAIANNDYVQAKKFFIQAIPADSVSLIAEVEHLFENQRSLMKPKPVVAKILSAIIPGSGQMYSGEYRNGINSFVLVGGLAVLTYYVASVYTILDAALAVFPWLQRYYTSGIRNAGLIADKKRRNKKQILLNEISTFVSQGSLIVAE
ncbi:MAG: hypothetical protein C0594_14140 [Marinilabiliales bacterium]|nr:MAG: hypothetical protein C0594_14140 [Marinilabiliales bacterium]